MLKKTFTISLFFAFIAFSYAANEDLGLLATVNGEPITLTDVMAITHTQEMQLPLTYKGEELQKELLELRKKALETVIERKLIFDDFKKYDFKLPREFIESNMDRILKTYNISTRYELESILREQGKTLAEFKSKAYESIAVDALIYGKCYKEVFITPKEVNDYYNTHKDEFTTPSSIRLSVITLKKTGAHKSDAEVLSKTLFNTLKNGDQEAFIDSVSLYSDGPNLKNGGDIGWIPLNELRKEFLVALGNYKKGGVYGPIELKDAIYILRVNDYRQQHIQSYEDSKSEIRTKLTEQAREDKYKSYVANLKSNAYIVYYI